MPSPSPEKAQTSRAVREGSLDPPTRHPLDWRHDDFYDMDAIEAEMTRVFDVCHGCRRCFNLCDSFPRLFDLIDESDTGEVDSLKPKSDFAHIAEACTLCDMCFMTKCPYVPPHPFNIDFPHLILRYRAACKRKHGAPFTESQLAQTDRNGAIAKTLSGPMNWGSNKENRLTRPLLQAVAGIDSRVELPLYHAKDFQSQVKKTGQKQPATPTKRKTLLYPSCIVNYNNPKTGHAAKAVLEANGVETRICYPGCCGMPFLEHGDIARVAKQAQIVSEALRPHIDEGFQIVVPTASCSLMMKFEWPLILPENENVQRLSRSCRDICQYVVEISSAEGLSVKPEPVKDGIRLHMACHARAQNMGRKSAELLALIPDTKLHVVERCSGHGGTFGIMKKTHTLAKKAARPAVRALAGHPSAHICSDCPLGCKHLAQELSAQNPGSAPEQPEHPIEIFATACGLI